MAKCFNTLVAEARKAVSPVTAHQAAQLHQREETIFVDPRPNAARSETGIIPGAHNVTLEDIGLGNLPREFADKSVHVVASCQAGPMGALAAHAFKKSGFSRVNFIGDGTQGWIDAGFSTEQTR